jgi:hypothetical protein
MDIKLVSQVDATNPDENDIALDGPNGDVVWLGTSGALDPEEVAQHIRVRLRFWKGEDVAAPDEGTPYLDAILDKGASDGRIASILRRIVLGTPGVASINSFSTELDKAESVLIVKFEAVLDGGHVLNSDDFGPFIAEV